MSNNPMKRPVKGRKLRTLTKKVSYKGVFLEVPLRKGDYNWRKLAGQR